MAFTAANFTNLTGMAPGRSLYRYDTADALTAVEVTGYINNTDDAQNLSKGDHIFVTVWGTLYTGFPTDQGWLVVNDVDANGDVGLTTDQLAGTFTSTA